MADRLSYWAKVLLIIGGLNIGLGEFGSTFAFLNLLPLTLATIVYYLIGLSAIYIGYNLLTNK